MRHPLLRLIWRHLCALCVFCILPLCIEAQKTLWIGNSYTGFNALPDLWHNMATYGGHAPDTYYRVIGGSTLARLANDSLVLDLLQQPWDILILQPNGVETCRPMDTVRIYTEPQLAYLDSLARAINPAVKVYLYQPFNRRLGVVHLCSIDPVVCSYIGAASRTIANTDSLTRRHAVVNVPVGLAFKLHFEEGNVFKLWHSDNLHPSYRGSYLAAVLFYQAIYGRTLPDILYSGDLPQDTALMIWNLANETWQSLVDDNFEMPASFESVRCAVSPNPTTNGVLHIEIKNRFVSGISLIHVSGIYALHRMIEPALIYELDLKDIPCGSYHLTVYDNFGDRYSLLISHG